MSERVNRNDPDAVAHAASERSTTRKTISQTKEDQKQIQPLVNTAMSFGAPEQGMKLPDIPQAELDMPPEEVARRAFNHGALLDPSTRSIALEELTARSHLASTETGRALRNILDNADRAVDVLSLIGYQQLRHLRANGISLSRIAKDLGVNLNDLTAFMSQAPTASEDAMIDEEAYADTKASELLEELETVQPTSNLTTDVLKTRMTLLLEMNKRLSHKWAQRSDDEIVQRMPTLHINLTTMAPTARMIADSNTPRTITRVSPEQVSEGAYYQSIDIEQYPDDGDDDLPMVSPIILNEDEHES
jgi:DNA-binding transcriptional MerR regulator